MKRHGFTLIELLVVIAILSILVTLGSKGLRSARLSAKKAKAMVEMQSIETAVKSYFNEYGKLPVDDGWQGQADPDPDAALSREVVAILAGQSESGNPTGRVFLEPQSQSESTGQFLDPWGRQYLICLDTDYDGEIAYGSERVQRKVGAVSIGLYELNGSSDADDLIKSWR